MIGCLLAPIFWIYFAIKSFVLWCVHHGWKGLLVMGIVILAIFILVGKIIPDKIPEQTKIAQASEPSTFQAPYIIQTISRYYFVKEYEVDGDNYILIKYWEFDGTEWKPNLKELVITPAWGSVSVLKR